MTKEEIEITEIVNRETRAWDTLDATLLISVFHPDMVWPWPEKGIAAGAGKRVLGGRK